MASKEEYIPVPLDHVDSVDTTESSRLHVDHEELNPIMLKSNYHRHGRYWRVLGPLAWMITTSLLAAVCILLTAAVTRRPTEAECTERLSIWCKSFVFVWHGRDVHIGFEICKLTKVYSARF